MNPTTRAKIAANERWSRPGARAQQSAALRAAHRRRLAEEIDPDGRMTPAELESALENARKAIGHRLAAARAARAAERRGDR